ncbi:MAG: response regulator, partial [Alphaproteobacteria bacterium]|nr:response regulator [Alphaproteobacteria bacterium]
NNIYSISKQLLSQHFAAISEYTNTPVASREDTAELFVSVTFDDGYKSFLTEVVPLAETYQIPIHVFIAREFILQGGSLFRGQTTSIASEISTRVLIIESDASTADGLSTLIEELGHTTCGKAHSPREALTLASREKPGLILTELAFQEEASGISTIEEILKDHDVPVIVITDHPDLWQKDCGITPAGIITKPFLSDTVRTAVSRALFFDRRAKYPFWDYEKENFTSH